MAKKLSAFEQAFADARKAGQKEFDFNGKKFHTRMASEETSSAGGAPKFGEYKPRDAYMRQGEEMTSQNYKPRREPKPLTEVTKPGTNTNYENTETSDMSFKRGGSVGSASRRADGIAQRGKTKGRMI